MKNQTNVLKINVKCEKGAHFAHILISFGHRLRKELTLFFVNLGKLASKYRDGVICFLLSITLFLKICFTVSYTCIKQRGKHIKDYETYNKVGELPRVKFQAQSRHIHIQVTFRTHSSYIQVTFRTHLSYIQWTFRNI